MHHEFRSVKRRLNQWRRAHNGQGRIPETLWTEAVELALAHGIERTADVLALNANRLEERVDERRGQRRSSADSDPTFVELSLPQMQSRAGCTLEAEGRDGRRLKVELTGEAASQAASVARVLWEGEA